MNKIDARGDKRFSFATGADGYRGERATFGRFLRSFVMPHWRVLAISIVAMTATAITSGALPFILQRVGDDVFVAKDTTLVYAIPALLVVVMFFRAVADWVATVADASFGTKIVADLRFRMFDTIAAADLAWIQGSHSGQFVSAFINDPMVIDRAATKVLTGLFKNGLSLIFLFSAMVYMDWRLSLVVMIGTPIAFLHMKRQKTRVRRSAGRLMQQAGDLSSILTQTLQTMRVVKAYGQEAYETRRFRQVVRTLRKYLMKTTRSRATVGPVWEAMIGFGLAAGIFYGGLQGIYGNVTLGQFMGFMTAALLAFQPMRSLASVQVTLGEGMLAAERVFALIDNASHVVEVRGAKPLRVTAGAISFRNVDFAYEGGGPVLANFDLEIAAGQKVALVGPSGAGKSTVLNLILRFFDPSNGAILIDGQDIRAATLASVRGASALLTQDPVLFDDTIGANIAYGSETADEEEVIAAADAAAAHEFIMRLPDGYQTRVGESGIRLSGGERQRVAFARAILRNTPILLLDEPTSALDAEAEAKVQAALERLQRGRTVVIIAHRLSTVQKADLICFMDGGRIVESGTHAELLARRGKYAWVVQTQLLADAPVLQAAGG